MLAIGDVHLGTRPSSLPEDLAETGIDNGNSCTGFSSNYIRVRVSDAPPECAGEILPVRITDAGAGAGIATGQMARGSKARR